MKKGYIIVAIVAIIIATAAGIGYYAYRSLHEACVDRTLHLYISKDTPYESVAEQIHDAITNDRAFDYYAEKNDLEHSFEPGHYLLTIDMSVVQIVRTLKLGWQTPVRVTMNNAKIPAQLAKKLEGQIEADSTAIIAVIGSDKVAKQYGFKSALAMYSMIIPNTYEMYWDTSVEDFVERMHTEYERFWTKERDSKRRRSGLSRLQVMTLASIVYEETRKGDEMPRVAGVYINRLRKGMPLQADPTIKYALQDFGLRRILNKHLKHPSPYNTYINKGLPPTPICMPSITAIDAVLNYESHNYLYFCARETFDGYHNFAATYNEHLQNARKYQRELNRRGIR